MNLSLEGKNAFVSGSSRGIGKAAAIELVKLGAEVTVVSRSADKLKNVITELDTSYGQKHDWITIDYNDPENLRQKVERKLKSKTYQILINNTGGPPAGPIVGANADQFLKAINSHLICNHILTKLMIPGMKESGYGRIINIISTSVKTPLDNLGVSNTTRGAVASWGKTMANELGRYGITVNNVLPGLIDTERLNEVFSYWAEQQSMGMETLKENASKEVPLKRIGNPNEIANVIAFLASPAGSYVSGVNLPVDGGRTKAM